MIFTFTTSCCLTLVNEQGISAGLEGFKRRGQRLAAFKTNKVSHLKKNTFASVLFRCTANIENIRNVLKQLGFLKMMWSNNTYE